MTASTDSGPKASVLSGRNSVLAGLFFVMAYLWPNSSGLGFSMCWFHSFTQLPCPACGTTRSVWAIVHGQWLHAWQLNPLGFLTCGLALLFFIGPLVHHLVPGLDARIASSKWRNYATLTVLAVVVVFGILRLAAFRYPILANLMHITPAI